MILVKTITTAIKDGWRTIKTIYGKNVVNTSKNATPFGVDGNPPQNIRAIMADTMSNEEPVIIGYLNEKALDLNIGDSAQFSTDENGNIKATSILRNDGTAEILGNDDNMVRYSVLKTEYDKTKAVLDAILTTLETPIPEPGNGAPSAFQAAMKTAVGILETGDISNSKIEEIKTLKST